jgi:hypothetical protein
MAYPVTTEGDYVNRLWVPIKDCGMGRVINLRTERKRAKRRVAEEEAAARRAAFGRSKGETNLERARSDKARTSLDQHRIKTGDLE